MPYTNLAAVTSKMPLIHVKEALDNTGEGLDEEALQEAFDTVVETCDNEIDAELGGRFAVPFTDPPAKVKHASLIFVLEALYEGRGVEEKNPWRRKAKELRDDLKAIGQGTMALTPQADNTASKPSGYANTSDNPAISSCGSLAT